MKNFTHKLIFITDLHITSSGEKIIGLDPIARLRLCLAHASRNHPDADGLILMGDLTHDGTQEQYQILKRTIIGALWPVYMTIGNHDLRENFRVVFPESPNNINGFIQHSVTVGHHTIILMDTNDTTTEPYHGGNLCDHRLSWLEAELKNKNNQSVIIAMHHPPFTTGFPGMDNIGLNNRNLFNNIIRTNPAVSMVIAGHVHRTIIGTSGGKPCVILKSPCHQMPLDLYGENSSSSVDEPGAYGLLLLGNDSPVLLTEDVGLKKQYTKARKRLS